MRPFLAKFRVGLTALALALLPPAAHSAEDFRLSAPRTLVESGLLRYVLPRFSLKTGVRIELVDERAEADAVLAPDGDGTRVFTGPGATWRLRLRNPGHDGAQRFAGWLTSEIGQRTITSYTVDGAAPFAPPSAAEVEVVAVTFDGDAVKGRELSHTHCGRCHVVSDDNRMNAIGSTPSFFVLRTFVDWGTRFQSFYVLNPHPAFTQVAEVTQPFPIDLPPPIAPVEITLDDLEAILAYVSGIEPADLGMPLDHQ